MSKTILYVKQGCPWCADALKYFSEVGLELDLVDVRTDPSRIPELQQVSGQTKAPTLKNGDFVVADFDVGEFKRHFVKIRGSKKARAVGLACPNWLKNFIQRRISLLSPQAGTVFDELQVDGVFLIGIMCSDIFKH